MNTATQQLGTLDAPDRSLANVIPHEYARKRDLFPVSLDSNGLLTVAVPERLLNDLDEQSSVRALAMANSSRVKKVQFVQATKDQLRNGQQCVYRTSQITITESIDLPGRPEDRGEILPPLPR